MPSRSRLLHVYNSVRYCGCVNTLYGTETGTNLKLGFGSYDVTEANNFYLDGDISQPIYSQNGNAGFVGIIHPKTCTVTTTLFLIHNRNARQS
jgi:hypothetical protein